MVATSDFSGLTSSICALARAAASARSTHWRCCIVILDVQDIEADGARFRALGSDAMADGLLCIRRHEAPQFGLGGFMFVMCRAGSDENCGQFGPRIR